MWVLYDSALADGEFFEGRRVCSRSCGRFTSRPQPVRRRTDVV